MPWFGKADAIGRSGLGFLGATGSLGLFMFGAPGPATQGVPFNFTPGLGGGTAPYTVTLTAGTLPAGLSLNATTGAITGTPTTLGTSSGITLHAVDSAGSPAHVDLTGLSIVVSAALAITGSPGTTGTVGLGYDFIPGTSGGRGTITFGLAGSLTGSGLAFNPATGELSAASLGPAGTYGPYTITATDADGRTASLAPFSIVVSAAVGGGHAGQPIGLSLLLLRAA